MSLVHPYCVFNITTFLEFGIQGVSSPTQAVQKAEEEEETEEGGASEYTGRGSLAGCV